MNIYQIFIDNVKEFTDHLSICKISSSWKTEIRLSYTKLAIEHRLTSTHPKTNNIVKRFNRCMEDELQN